MTEESFACKANKNFSQCSSFSCREGELLPLLVREFTGAAESQFLMTCAVDSFLNFGSQPPLTLAKISKFIFPCWRFWKASDEFAFCVPIQPALSGTLASVAGAVEWASLTNIPGLLVLRRVLRRVLRHGLVRRLLRIRSFTRRERWCLVLKTTDARREILLGSCVGDMPRTFDVESKILFLCTFFLHCDRVVAWFDRFLQTVLVGQINCGRWRSGPNKVDKLKKTPKTWFLRFQHSQFAVNKTKLVSLQLEKVLFSFAETYNPLLLFFFMNSAEFVGRRGKLSAVLQMTRNKEQNLGCWETNKHLK